MQDGNYRLAGIAALVSAVLFIPTMGLLVFNDLQMHPQYPGPKFDVDLLPMVIALDVLSKLLIIYALLRFKHLLNSRYNFHGVDVLIPILIGAGILTGAISYLARFIQPWLPSAFAGAFAAVILGVVGIVYARRLLKMNGNLNGYLKPLAYTTMAGSICFLLLILAPIGLMLLCAGDVILALVLFKGDELEELQVV